MIKLKESALESSNSKKHYCRDIDSKFVGNKAKGRISEWVSQVNKACQIFTSKICAARRDWNYMFCPGWRVIWILTKKILLKTYITSLFNYCPLVWMCYNRSLNNNIDISHELALRIVFQDKKSDFETLLEMKNNISLDVMRDIFHFWKWKLQLKEWYGRSCKYEMEL